MRISAAINGYSYIYRMSDQRSWHEADQLDDALRRQLVTHFESHLSRWTDATKEQKARSPVSRGPIATYEIRVIRDVSLWRVHWRSPEWLSRSPK